MMRWVPEKPNPSPDTLWRPVFLLFPEKVDGQMVWLEWVYRRRRKHTNFFTYTFDYATELSEHWVYYDWCTLCGERMPYDNCQKCPTCDSDLGAALDLHSHGGRHE